ncbi:type II secretion system F family protein, partial [Shewanella sairae]
SIKRNVPYWVSAFISSFKFNKKDIRQKLETAGIYSEYISNIYYLAKVIPFFIVISVLSYCLYNNSISFIFFIVMSFVGLVFFIIGPDIYISKKGKRNISRISSRLPFLSDLMSICINTGMTTESTLSYLSKEMVIIDRDLAFILKKTVDRTEIVGIEKALMYFSETIPTNEARSFSVTLLNAVRFGTSIGPVLTSLASDMREVNMLELEEKVGKMGAKMSIPMIVFIMIPIVVLIVAPGIMRIFMK